MYLTSNIYRELFGLPSLRFSNVLYFLEEILSLAGSCSFRFERRSAQTVVLWTNPLAKNVLELESSVRPNLMGLEIQNS